MSSNPQPGKNYDRFLAWLDFNRERAIGTHDSIRAKLMRLFGRWGIAPTEDLANEALLRAAKKFENGGYIANPEATPYILTVARLMRAEHFRNVRKAPEALPENFDLPSRDERTDKSFERQEEVARVMDSLQVLRPEERSVLLEYFREEEEGRIRIASRLGITPNALRFRVHYYIKKLREKLEPSKIASPGD